MNKFKKILESCYLCIRFPFLYPRNRFTGRNRKNVLHKPLWNLKNKSVLDISITGKLVNNETKKKFYSTYANFLNYVIKLDKETKTISIVNSILNINKTHNLKSLLWKDDRFEILGLELVFALGGNPIIQVVVETKDKTDKSNYGFHHESVQTITNRWKFFWYKVLEWIDSEILDRILFIPTWNELDAMPTGWRNAFGIQMCKEIKVALKKNHYLYKYRIMQIKEKFGSLRWYDAGAPSEVYDIIDKYEDISYKTCIVCGKPAELISSGWISPYCRNHYPKHDPAVYQVKVGDHWEETKEFQKSLEEIDRQYAENKKEV